MAPKSSLLSHQPSKHEEEDDSEESSSGEEEGEEDQNSSDEETEAGSSDDEGQNQGTPNNHKPPVPAPKLDPKSDSGGSGSDSDADSEESPSDYKLQPIGKGSEYSSKRSRDGIQNSSLPTHKSLRSEEKKSASSPGGSIIRLWSNEDEIAVLNGMIEFKTVKGLDPNADMGAFHTFIKGKLTVDYSRDQLRTKITRMKKRFSNALKKGVKGSDPVFSKPHEDLAFKISKKIWGINEDVKKEIKKLEKDVVDEDEVVGREEDGEVGEFWSKYPNLNASFDSIKSSFPSLAPGGRTSLLKEKLSFIGNVKAKELDDKWKQLALEEVELSYKILALIKEQVQMAIDQ